MSIVVIALAAACGGNNPGGGGPDAARAIDAAPPDAPAPVTLADLCGPNGVVPQLLERLVACNPAFDTLFLQGRLTPAVEQAFCQGQLGPYVSDGSIALPSRAALQACLDYISSTACVDLRFDVATGPCAILVGQQADTAPCEITEQCASASYCDTSGGGSCGACAPRLPDGMPCTADDQCVHGACVGTQCGHFGADGDPCFADNDCLGQRTCDLQTNQCQTPPSWVVNQACNPGGGNNDCAPFTTGLYCKSIGGGNGQCAPFLALDAACRTGGVAQGLCDVRAYQWCPPGADAVCTAPTTVSVEGQGCSLIQGRKCGTGLTCTNVLNNGTCVSYQEASQACVPNGQPTDQCDLFLSCVNTGTAEVCQYGNYSGACP